ncbi:hypothetical protein [Bacterioplanoides sp.]|uniref:hypothetical protein n=1 Tax=Bacterioplanoides sp. TaxID=2066072 RepID=UPI003B5C567D
MKKIFALFIILISSSVFADWMEDPCVLFNEKGTKCTYTIDDVKLIISPNGEVVFNKAKLQVNLPEHFEIEEVRDGQIFGDTVFLSLAITDHESGGTVIISMSLQNKKINWSREFPAFNSSPLLIHENELYIGGIGRVAKYSALDGKLVWELKGLYERETQAFNGFNKPVISGDSVEFPESKVSTAKYSGIRKVVVNRKTGKLVSS